MRFSNGERADDPLRRFRAGWRARARSVKDTWLPRTLPIESTLESTSARESRSPRSSWRKKDTASSRANFGPASSERSRGAGALLEGASAAPAAPPPSAAAAPDRSARRRWLVGPS